MLAFVHIRKTGGSTVDTILRQSFKAGHLRVRLGPRRATRPVATAREIRRCQWVYWRLQAVSGHGIVPYSDLPKLYPGVRFFTFVREPLSRCASDYQFRVTRGGLKMRFQDWIETDAARNQQCKKLAVAGTADAAIEAIRTHVPFVGVLEQFDESLVRLKRWSGLAELDIRYRPKNVARDINIKRQLLRDTRARNIISEANREDTRLYEFVTREYLPRARREYGSSLDYDVQQFRSANDPLPIYPRQLPSMLLRELVYKPLAPALRLRDNPTTACRQEAA